MSQFFNNSFLDLLPPELRLAQQARQRREPVFPPLLPEEEDEFATGLLGQSMGLMQYFGETIGKSSRASRGLLSGRPEAILNLIPFSDALGITDPQEDISGRQLLEQWGLAGPNDPDKWFEPADIAGFALEVATDPLSWLFPGGAALGKAGQALKRAGLLDDVTKFAGKEAGKRQSRFKTVHDVMKRADEKELKAAQEAADFMGVDLKEAADQTLGGLMGWGLPFGKTRGVIGTGPKALQVAKGMDWLGEKAATLPGVAGTRSLFDKAMKGVVYEPAQRVLGPLAKRLRSSKVTAEEELWEQVRNIPEFSDPAKNESFGAYWEHGDAYKEMFDNLPEIGEDAKKAIVRMRDFDTELAQLVRDNGTELGEFTSQYDQHFHSFHAALFPDVPSEGFYKSSLYERAEAQSFQTGGNILLPRKEAIRDVWGGRTTINRLVTDPDLVGADKLDLEERIAKIQKVADPATPEEVLAMKEAAETQEISKWSTERGFSAKTKWENAVLDVVRESDPPINAGALRHAVHTAHKEVREAVKLSNKKNKVEGFKKRDSQTGEYSGTVGGKQFVIYRDPDTNQWWGPEEGGPWGYPLGDTKKEAIETLQNRLGLRSDYEPERVIAKSDKDFIKSVIDEELGDWRT
jgi:hypothetical protein